MCIAPVRSAMDSMWRKCRDQLLFLIPDMVSVGNRRVERGLAALHSRVVRQIQPERSHCESSSIIQTDEKGGTLYSLAATGCRGCDDSGHGCGACVGTTAG